MIQFPEDVQCTSFCSPAAATHCLTCEAQQESVPRQSRQRRGNIKHIPAVGIWMSSCQAQSACGCRDHEGRAQASATLGELAACRLGSAGSIWSSPLEHCLISKVWEVCPGGWHPFVGQRRGVQLWHSGFQERGWCGGGEYFTYRGVYDSGRRETPELPQSHPNPGLASPVS